jgi:hypothetical protein
MRFSPRLAIAVVLCTTLHGPAIAQEEAGRNGRLCTLAWDGLAAGISTERNVLAMYGKGLLDPHGGDTGARYYTDRNHSMTLAFEFGIDRIITGITVTRGLHPPAKSGKDAATTMLSPQLDPKIRAYPVTLGMTK